MRNPDETALRLYVAMKTIEDNDPEDTIDISLDGGQCGLIMAAMGALNDQLEDLIEITKDEAVAGRLKGGAVKSLKDLSEANKKIATFFADVIEAQKMQEDVA